MRVALIGDSIRLNAQPFVQARLPMAFRLRAPEENCESSRKVSENIRRWVPFGSADIVHLNCGLHDIRYDPGCERPVSSIDEYERNLRDVFAYLVNTGATIVWATSTPIDEARHRATKLSRRYCAELLEYNRRAVSIAHDFGCMVNDLYACAVAGGGSELLLPDGVHFNRDGNALIGRAIADAIVLAASAHAARANAYS